MVAIQLTDGNDYFGSHLVPENGETGNIIHGRGGNDIIIGNDYPDVITGDSGSDRIEGRGGNDILVGGAGADTLQGDGGNDFIHGGSENDTLYGGSGSDTLYGGTGNDSYRSYIADGSLDIVNDDKSEAGQPGYGSGLDHLWVRDAPLDELWLVQDGDDLQVTDSSDVADGYADNGILMEDFFLGGDNVIERLYGADGSIYFDLTLLIA
ncbi:MAG: hypothetical protein U0S49_07190 [Rhodospirillales bacterium]|nr:hypothetical protein [Rhodospirillales bacterium]